MIHCMRETGLWRLWRGFGVICILLSSIGFVSGCWEPCSANNNCSDGIYCNGLEVCSPDGAYIICDEIVLIECDEGFVCDEELDACVPASS